jgi:transposase-like protein
MNKKVLSSSCKTAEAVCPHCKKVFLSVIVAGKNISTYCSNLCGLRATAEKRREKILEFYRNNPSVCKERAKIHKKYDDEMIDEACRLYVEEKLSIRAAARKLSVSHPNVQYWLKIRNIQLRTKSEAMKGFKPKKESVEKMRKTKSGVNLKDWHKKKIGDALRGKKKSKEFVRNMSLARRGKNNPNYNPDRSKLERARLGRSWNLGYGCWSKGVKKRDRCCIVCGSEEKLVSHHLDNFYEFEDKRTDLDNGVTLCRECHKKFHRLYGRKHNTEEQFKQFLVSLFHNVLYKRVA